MLRASAQHASCNAHRATNGERSAPQASRVSTRDGIAAMPVRSGWRYALVGVAGSRTHSLGPTLKGSQVGAPGTKDDPVPQGPGGFAHEGMPVPSDRPPFRLLRWFVRSRTRARQGKPRTAWRPKGGHGRCPLCIRSHRVELDNRKRTRGCSEQHCCSKRSIGPCTEQAAYNICEPQPFRRSSSSGRTCWTSFEHGKLAARSRHRPMRCLGP